MLVFPDVLSYNRAYDWLSAGPFAYGQVTRDDWVEYWPMSAFLGDCEGALACDDLSADCFAGSLADCLGEVDVGVLQMDGGFHHLVAVQILFPRLGGGERL